MNVEYTLTLSRLNCSGCAKNVTRAIEVEPSGEVISTDIPTKSVHLRFDEKQTTLEKIKATLANANYPVVTEKQLNKEGARH